MYILDPVVVTSYFVPILVPANAIINAKLLKSQQQFHNAVVTKVNYVLLYF